MRVTKSTKVATLMPPHFLQPAPPPSEPVLELKIFIKGSNLKFTAPLSLGALWAAVLACQSTDPHSAIL